MCSLEKEGRKLKKKSVCLCMCTYIECQKYIKSYCVEKGSIIANSNYIVIGNRTYSINSTVKNDNICSQGTHWSAPPLSQWLVNVCLAILL